jgi:hypothetical protein
MRQKTYRQIVALLACAAILLLVPCIASAAGGMRVVIDSGRRYTIIAHNAEARIFLDGFGYRWSRVSRCSRRKRS